MTTDLLPSLRPTNRNAAICFASGLLTLLAVCIAIIPVPFTGYICFPAAAILSLAAALNGIRALRRFGTLTGTEKGLVVTGLGASAASVLLMTCSGVVVAVFGLRIVEAVRQLAP